MSMNVQFLFVSPDGGTQVATSTETVLNSEELQNLMILARTSAEDQDQSHGYQTVEILPQDASMLEPVANLDGSPNSVPCRMVLNPKDYDPNQDGLHVLHTEAVSQEEQIELNTQISKAVEVATKRSISDKKKKRYTSEKTFPCETCGKKFPSSSNLTRHIRIHTGEKPYKCQHCDKSYAQIDHLKRHEGLHTGIMAYECSICKKKYQEKFRLVVHMRNHTGERPFKCSLCEKGFTTARALIKHKRWHTGERNYECDFCLKRFVDYAGLCTHRKIHTGEKPHKCLFCQRGFIAKKDLISHERLHTGDLPFQCETCDKRFPRKTALAQHMKTHSDIRPHVCKFCNKTFRQKPSLRNHILIHTNERPYDCDYCLKRFRRKDSMESHRLKHESQEKTPVGFTCSVCSKVLKTRHSLQVHAQSHEEHEPSIENATQTVATIATDEEENSDISFVEIKSLPPDVYSIVAEASGNAAVTPGVCEPLSHHDYSKTPQTDSEDSNEVHGSSSLTVSTQTECEILLESLMNRNKTETSYPDRKESFISADMLPNVPTKRKRLKSV